MDAFEGAADVELEVEGFEDDSRMFPEAAVVANFDEIRAPTNGISLADGLVFADLAGNVQRFSPEFPQDEPTILAKNLKQPFGLVYGKRSSRHVLLSIRIDGESSGPNPLVFNGNNGALSKITLDQWNSNGWPGVHVFDSRRGQPQTHDRWSGSTRQCDKGREVEILSQDNTIVT